MSITDVRKDTTTDLVGLADLKLDTATTSYDSANDLMQALIRAATAHGEHEKRTGQYDEKWPQWYAAYMVAEQSGAELPS